MKIATVVIVAAAALVAGGRGVAGEAVLHDSSGKQFSGSVTWHSDDAVWADIEVSD